MPPSRSFSKPFTYLLLLAVCTVWGMVMYRFFQPMGSGYNVTEFPPEADVRGEIPDGINDSFALLAAYRDPFLGTLPNLRLPQTGRKKILPEKAFRSPKPATDWSFIRYRGLIRNKQKTVALLVISGKENTVFVNDTTAGVKVLAIYKDSVTVEYAGENGTISK